MISSAAPSRSVPSVTRSKQNRSESATTPESAPISSRTQVTLAPGRRWVTASTRPSVMASSCTCWLAFVSGSADPGQRVADQQVHDPGAAERCLQLDDAGWLRCHPADDGRVRALRMRPQCGERGLRAVVIHHGDEPALAGHVHRVDAEQLGGPSYFVPDGNVVLVDENADAGCYRDLVQDRRDAAPGGIP